MTDDAIPTAEAEAGAASEYYRGASGQSYHRDKRGIDPEALEWVYRLRAAKFQPMVNPTDHVFEWGVGAGWNLARLRCSRRVGFDAADFLAPELKALGIDFCEAPQAIADGTMDVVICHQALEHLLEPAAALREMRRMLSGKGRLILHVPWEVERRFARYRPDDPNRHLYHWNAQNLGNLLTVLGWRILQIRVRRYGYDRRAANWALRMRTGERGFRALRRLMILLLPLREVEVIAGR